MFHITCALLVLSARSTTNFTQMASLKQKEQWINTKHRPAALSHIRFLNSGRGDNGIFHGVIYFLLENLIHDFLK